MRGVFRGVMGAVACLALSALVQGCSDDGSKLVVPGPGSPAFIGADSGDGQTGTAGTQLPAPLVALVTDSRGTPVPGVAITFAVASGGGSVGAPSATTNGAGRASTTFTLGAVPGANTVTATIASVQSSGGPQPIVSTVTFTATGVAGAPATVAATSGDGQSGPVNVVLGAPLVVTVRDAAGNLVPGETVTFAVTAGSATVGTPVAVTNAQGVAQTTATPTAIGFITITATAGTATTTFTVSGSSAVVGFGTFFGGTGAFSGATVFTPVEPRGIAVGQFSSNNDRVYFSARRADSNATLRTQCIYVTTKGGTPLFAREVGRALDQGTVVGSPYHVVAMALSPDEGTLYFVDHAGTNSVVGGANDTITRGVSGGVWRVPADLSAAPTLVSTAGDIDLPTGIVVSGDGTRLFVTGFIASGANAGKGALFSLPATGGAATLLLRGGPGNPGEFAFLSAPVGITLREASFLAPATMLIVDAGLMLESGVARDNTWRLISLDASGASPQVTFQSATNSRVEVGSGVASRPNGVVGNDTRVASRTGNAGAIVDVGTGNTAVGTPFVEPYGVATDGVDFFIADSDAAGNGQIHRRP